MKNGLLLLLLPLMLAANCKKKTVTELDKLPVATQTGANTMGCLVNGKAWLPDTRDNGSIPQLKAINAKFWNVNTQILFTFYRQRNPDDQDLTLFIKGFTGAGSYNLNSTSQILGIPGSTGNLSSYGCFADDNIKKTYVTNEKYTGTVLIKFYDPTSKVIAGSFELRCADYYGSSDSLVVSEGRFDCKMN